jgi:hypothetical protein
MAHLIAVLLCGCPTQTPPTKGQAMTTRATGTFEVKLATQPAEANGASWQTGFNQINKARLMKQNLYGVR